MRKGITPVIAMILLILIVVALGGVFAAWTTRTWETLGEAGEEQIETVTENLQKSISIDSVDCVTTGNIYIRNMGNQDINCNEIGAYIGDVMQTITCQDPSAAALDPIPAGSIGVLVTGFGPIGADVEARVTVAGNAATYKC